jgi:hypothetical protein
MDRTERLRDEQLHPSTDELGHLVPEQLTGARVGVEHRAVRLDEQHGVRCALEHGRRIQLLRQ